MESRPLRFIVTVLFFSLLAVVGILNHRVVTPPTPNAVNCASALSRYGFCLQEVSHQSGIDFVHQAPTLDSKLSPIMPEVASMGAAVSVSDFNHSGYPSIYVCNSAVGSQNHLYLNLGNGKFRDVAPEMGVADVNKPGMGVSMGAIWGDYDNDGYEDLLIYKWGGPPILFRNEGGKKFVDVSAQAGLPREIVNANSATWVDFDGDGKLDLLIAGYYPDNLDLWHLKNTRMMPDSFEYADNGGRKWLLRNMGNGKFQDVTAQMGIDSSRWTLAVGAADLQGTGYPDLVLANDYGVTEVYQNDHGKHFTEIGKRLGIGFAPKSGMNVAFGDIINDGQYAIYVSNISAEGNLIQGNNLWVPKEGTSGANLAYTNWASSSGVFLGGWSFGAQFGDLNNDGNLDLALTNGYISANPQKTYWDDFSKITGGGASLISDAKNWPPMGNMSLSGYEQKKVWLGDGTGKFTDVAQAVGYTDTHDGRSLALADLWNTGMLDMIVANQKGPLLVYKNTVAPSNEWVELDLQGKKSNRSAIGADVTLYWKNGSGEEIEQRQEVAGASGFCAQNDRRLHFGLGKNAQIERAVIRWPVAGEAPQTVENLSPDKLFHIQEP
jgi:hypothetical protein